MSQINNPEVVAEIAELHARYEAALVNNDVPVLTSLFWTSPHALRFGVSECLYGSEEIEAFRKARSPLNLAREVSHLRIVTFHDDCAIVTLEFHRSTPKGIRHGRQSQVWHKFAEGWKIVSAHVSFVPDDPLDELAAAVGLIIPAELREGVKTNIDRAGRIAKPLLDYPLSDAIEVAPVFEP